MIEIWAAVEIMIFQSQPEIGNLVLLTIVEHGYDVEKVSKTGPPLRHMASQYETLRFFHLKRWHISFANV